MNPPAPSSAQHWRPTTIGALVAGAMVVVSFLVGAALGHGGFPALLYVGLPSIIGGAVAFSRPRLRPYAAGFLVAWFATLIVVVVAYVVLVAALSEPGA
ncbi:MAG: hypothetical protein H5T80_10210 [Dietzia sp.]|uniref:DUF4190 domain-containing protein n=1 Tax=Intrasporangium calvum TaxID=53358 RepID=A0ABT5GD28_9MICO|nr:hypothetical protein [Intrasporangium calvum]MBC7307280.1 hypothetical protein [Dietzia sp.]MDC5695680.1 hypothetical protein [Intrasporangium calvum]